MAGWTNVEIRRLKQAHIADRPSLDGLAAMFPRHTTKAVKSACYKYGLRHRIRWLRLAHEYYARRESGLLA